MEWERERKQRVCEIMRFREITAISNAEQVVWNLEKMKGTRKEWKGCL